MLAIDPSWQPEAQQANFRLLLDAMSYPGKYLNLNYVPKDYPIALTILSTLLDAQVSLADPHKLLKDEDWLMLQTKSEHQDNANYILCDASQIPDFTPKLGTLKSPEQSATLILVVDTLGVGELQLKLTGAGIKDHKTLNVTGMNKKWLTMRNEWNCSFPLGVDFILIDKTQIAALPRTTKVEIN